MTSFRGQLSFLRHTGDEPSGTGKDQHEYEDAPILLITRIQEEYYNQCKTCRDVGKEVILSRTPFVHQVKIFRISKFSCILFFVTSGSPSPSPSLFPLLLLSGLGQGDLSSRSIIDPHNVPETSESNSESEGDQSTIRGVRWI